MRQKILYPTHLLLLLDPKSEIRIWDLKSGMDKNLDPGSGIRDKHPGSATLAGFYVPPLERKLRKIFFSSFLISRVTSMYFKNDGLLPLSVILLKI
jgi:hypothetical protein